MGMRIALCQLLSVDDIVKNLEHMESAIVQNDADLYLFPEMFLTRYGNPGIDKEDQDNAIEWMKTICSERNVAIAMGMPMKDYGGVTNSLLFVTPKDVYRYDKLYLANFPPYDEGVFNKGQSPVMAEWKGFRIGLEVCYDVMFPELHRFYATHGADIVLVSSASAESSRPGMETIAPARSFENTVYTVYCNNIGTFKDLRFFGGSRVYSPLGKLMEQIDGDEEKVLVVEVDRSEVTESRRIRHHLKDLRDDILWV